MDVKNKLFYSLFVILYGIACAYLYFYGYYMSFIILNGFQAKWADFYFSKITHLGDGFTFSALFFLFYGKKYLSKSLSMIICLIISSLIVQLLKNFFFSEWYRPLVIFGKDLVNYLEGYDAYGKSFPSGHTTAIFTTVFCLMLWKEWNIFFQIVALIIAVSVAFSRIYLGVHFLGDVLAGIFIGFVVSHTGFHFFDLKTQKWNHLRLWKNFLFLISVIILLTLIALRLLFDKNF